MHLGHFHAALSPNTLQSNSRVQCNIGFAELAISMPHSHVDDIVPVLVDILGDVPYIDFDRCLSWDGTFSSVTMLQHVPHPSFLDWAMPDQLVSTTVTALLKIASAHPNYRQATFNAIVNLVKETIPRFKTEDRKQLNCYMSPIVLIVL